MMFDKHLTQPSGCASVICAENFMISMCILYVDSFILSKSHSFIRISENHHYMGIRNKNTDKINILPP